MVTDISKINEQEAFTHWYQEIYRMSDLEKVGVEYLFRKSSYSENLNHFFQGEKERGNSYKLNMLSMRKAFSTYSFQLMSGVLFLNVIPSTIMHPDFPEQLTELVRNKRMSSKNIVLDVIELDEINDRNKFIERVKYVKSFDFMIALSNVDKDLTTLYALIELEPDYIKLDTYFSDRLSRSRKKQRMIQMVMDYFMESDTQLILDGIEKLEDLYIAQTLGVHLCKGHLLHKPQPIITDQ